MASSLPGHRIGAGRTAEVFEWGNDRALKLLRPGLPRELIASEAAKTAAARAAGAPAPAIYEQIEIEGRSGVVVDRLGSRSMLGQILASPWGTWGWGRELARVHASVLACQSTELPNVKEVLAERIGKADPLPRVQRNRAKDALRHLPDGSAVLHGDFHPDNVFSTPSGPVLIDWTDATRGCMAADVVRTLWLLSTSALPPDLPRRRRALVLVGLLRTSYVRRSKRLTRVTREDLAGWWLPVLAARLSEGIESEEGALRRRVDELTGHRSSHRR